MNVPRSRCPRPAAAGLILALWLVPGPAPAGADGAKPDAAPREPAGTALSAKGWMLRRENPAKHEYNPEWKVVGEKEKLFTGDLLLGLPGAALESKDGSVRLKMLIDFDSPLPVLEPAVILHASPDFDLDFTLDRGRVDVINQKKEGPARVRVRAWGNTWEATLAAPGASLSMELLGRWRPGSRFTTKPGPRDVPSADLLFLVLAGEVDLKHGVNHFLMTAPPGPALIGWNNFVGMDATPQRLEKLPPWAVLPTDEAGKKRVEKIRAVRDHLANGFSTRPPGEVLDEMVNSEDPVYRRVAVVLMGALDDLRRLGNALHQEKYRDVWDNGVVVMRHWLGRAPGQDQRFYKGLLEVRGYTPVQAETLIEFLHGFTETDLERPETYEMLIDYLADDRISIRGLAYWHLVRLVPQGRTIPYDPMAPKGEREKARQEWKKLVPPGKMPPREKARP
jgi:hypothetical protein